MSTCLTFDQFIDFATRHGQLDLCPLYMEALRIRYPGVPPHKAARRPWTREDVLNAIADAVDYETAQNH